MNTNISKNTDGSLIPEVQEELSRFEREIAALEASQSDPLHFQKFRLNNGVYGIRKTDDQHMIRVKVLFGIMSADQLDAVAEVAEKYADPQVGHITTRQAIQVHRIKRPTLQQALTVIADAGLTSREACGNTVRNVSADPYAGIAGDEVFNVVPYADAVTRYFLRHPICQNLPRKFKIAFEGSPVDRARAPIHDVGLVAKTKEIDGKQVKGFALDVGGGLGAVPFSTYRLEEFVPTNLIIPSIEAIIHIFDRHGDRENRNTARLKFVIKRWGFEKFKEVFENERKLVISTSPGKAQWEIEHYEQAVPEVAVQEAPAALPEGFERWVETNTFKQKQEDFVAVHIRCPLGDIPVAQMRGVSELARTFGSGEVRTMITQNLLVPWVREASLAAFYNKLVSLGFAYTDAEHLADVTRCPGADTCQLAITHSRGLAADLGEMFGEADEALLDDEALKDLTIKISGCTNSCGHHHIADIGFHGAAAKVNGHTVPHYMVLAGGRTEEGKAEFGYRLGMVPAKRAKEATTRLLELFRDGKQDGENFRTWVERAGVDVLKKELDPFRTLPEFDQDPDAYEDLGDKGEFKVEVGPGECAA